MTKSLAISFALQRMEVVLRAGWLAFIGVALLSLLATSAFAHGVAEDDNGAQQF